MVWERIQAWLDNPIFVKRLRSRLRVQAVISADRGGAGVCLCIAWAGFQLKGFDNGTAFGWLLFLQVIIIVAVGGAQAASAVAGETDIGDSGFSPGLSTSRDALTLGFFFGAPIREYILVATTLPYDLLCVGYGIPSAPRNDPGDHRVFGIRVALSRPGSFECTPLETAGRLARGGRRGRLPVHHLFMDRERNLRDHGPYRHAGRSGPEADLLRNLVAVAGRRADLYRRGSVLRLSGGPAADQQRANASAFKGSGARVDADALNPLGGWHLAARFVRRLAGGRAVFLRPRLDLRDSDGDACLSRNM